MQELQDRNFDEKSEILSEYDSQKGEGLSFYSLVLAYIFIATMVTLFIPVIYIRNEIYYISRDIDELRNKHSVLLEENKNLERNIEKLKFKYEILDPLTIELKK
ncbi:MAG: hypothetical protein GX282_04330 [Campylobacteraceae bacterium]|nr:hypothetical protein [Campylobacteraceae bacterium]